MRVEVLRELGPDDAKLELPWFSPTDPSLRYIDLKKFPQQIDHFAECREYPPLASLLRRINAPGSPLRSAKCDVWTTAELGEDERFDFDFPYKIGSYVDVVFQRPDFNSHLGPHLQCGKKIGQLLRGCRIQAQVEIALRRCLFHGQKRWGYYLTIFVHAYGATIAEAKAEWTRAVSALGDVLVQVGQAVCRLLPAPRGSGLLPARKEYRLGTPRQYRRQDPGIGPRALAHRARRKTAANDSRRAAAALCNIVSPSALCYTGWFPIGLPRPKMPHAVAERQRGFSRAH